MNITLKKDLLKAIGVPLLRKHGLAINEDALEGWQNQVSVNIAALRASQVEMLISLLEPHRQIRGTGVLIQDCTLWLNVVRGSDPKARSVKTFAAMLIAFMGKAPKHWLYSKDVMRDEWQAFYVAKVEYVPSQSHGGHYTPEHANMELRWTEFANRGALSITFWKADSVGMTVSEALAQAGYFAETEEFLAEYERRRIRFNKVVKKVGKQYLATGIGTDDVDGNNKKREDTWYWRRTTEITLAGVDGPARVVVDVFFEEDKNQRDERASSLHEGFWGKALTGREEDDPEEDEDGEAPVSQIDVPLHPMLVVFDLRRHLRLRVDVSQLTEYIYDASIGEKLILPKVERGLVELLLAHQGDFRDIVSGKSGGSVILCAGVPGTGKTLTAEVYAEAMERPLYSVQASQLGVNAEELEDELLKTFARSFRWNAILLLDEADVYVTTRGSDLVQNAIVGVFLRTLEYYKGVLFLTTNRADLVDDAIASRCLARITYKPPVPALQRRIWRVLADNSKIPLTDGVIDAIVERYPNLTGRDVKNLLKLASMVSKSKGGEEITIETVQYVKRFKPTQDVEAPVAKG